MNRESKTVTQFKGPEKPLGDIRRNADDKLPKEETRKRHDVNSVEDLLLAIKDLKLGVITAQGGLTLFLRKGGEFVEANATEMRKLVKELENMQDELNTMEKGYYDADDNPSDYVYDNGLMELALRIREVEDAVDRANKFLDYDW